MMVEKEKKDLLCICGHKMSEHEDKVGYSPPAYECTHAGCGCTNLLIETAEVRVAIIEHDLLEREKMDACRENIHCCVCWENIGSYSCYKSSRLICEHLCPDCWKCIRKVMKDKFEY